MKLVISATLAASLALSADRPLERIALGSCLNQTQPAPVLSAITKIRPQLMIWMGDNVYGDPDKGVAWEEVYQKQLQQPGLRALLRTPTLAIWDDGDSGLNDGGADDPYKAKGREAFVKFWKPDWLAQPGGPGLHGSRAFGPEGRRVQVILLDTRSFRSPLKAKRPDDPAPGRYDPDPDPQKTMLGEEQWRWLAQELRKPAQVRLIVSSIQVIPEDHKWEKWANLPLEQERLFKTIREAGASGVLFLSGDRHLAEFSMRDGGVGYPLYDFTSSSLNASRTEWRAYEPNRWRVSTLNVGHNFGMILIDWKRPDPLIRLQIRGEAGETLLQQTLPLSWLQPGKIKGSSS